MTAVTGTGPLKLPIPAPANTTPPPAPPAAPNPPAAPAGPPAPSAPTDSAAAVNQALRAASPMTGAPVQTTFPTPEPAPPASEEPENPEAEDEEDDGDWGISAFYQQQNTGTISTGGTATGNDTTTMGAALTYRRDATDDRLGIDAAVSYNQTNTQGRDGSQRQDSRFRAEATVGTNEAEMARARRLAQGGQQ